MGWGRMLLLGDWGQQMDIQDQRRELENARVSLQGQVYKDRSQDEQIAQLSAENENLRLYVFGLIRLLETKKILTSEDISQLVAGIEDEESDSGAAGPK